MLYKKGKFAEAKTWLTRATMPEEGRDAVIYEHLGDTLWRLGARYEAVKSWRRSLEIHADQMARASGDSDPQVETRVKDKLERAAQGGQPQVAVVGAESRPAP